MMCLVHPLPGNFVFCSQLMKSKHKAEINWVDKQQEFPHIPTPKLHLHKSLKSVSGQAAEERFICLHNLINNFALLTESHVFFTFTQVFERDKWQMTV